MSEEQLPEPSTVVTFTFADGGVASVTVADDWASRVELGQLGWTALIAYAEQRAQADVPVAVRPARGKRVPRELQDQAVTLSRELSSLLELLRAPAAPPVEGAAHVVSDPYRHVSITVEAGRASNIELNEQWLRTADLGEVENDLLAAFRELEQVEVPADGMAALSRFRERANNLARQYNEAVEGGSR